MMSERTAYVVMARVCRILYAVLPAMIKSLETSSKRLDP